MAARPEQTSAIYDQAVDLYNRGKYEEVDQLLQLEDDVDCLFARSLAVKRLRGPKDAIPILERAAEIGNDFKVFFNLGNFLEVTGKFEQAVATYRRAAAAAADPSARAHAGMMLMHLCYRLGWWSEFRNYLPNKYDYDAVSWWKTCLPIPVWDGTIKSGGRILIHGEAAFGDVIQCLRYAEYFRRRGMAAYFITNPALKLLCSLGKGVVDAYAYGEMFQPFDYRVQSYDLFYMLESDADRTFNSGPYLEIARSPHRAPTLARRPGEILIGIKWTTTDPAKDLPLALFAKLLVRDGIRLISLQPEPPRDDSGPPVERPLDPYFADTARSFVSTAWLIHQLDLVVTADSVIAHLAGAIGIKTWVALRAVPDCRWMVDRTDSPLYDSATLFRQRDAADWSAVFEAMAAALVAALAVMAERPAAAGGGDAAPP